jgi:hypothetical protein
MHPYTYSITLRVFHPNIDPSEITNVLALEPKRAWKAGDSRQTPNGTPLEGFYRESYWYSDLIPHGEHSSEGNLLEDYLDELAKQLAPSRAFFARVCSEGGRVEFFIGMYGARNYGFELPPSLLSAVADIGLSLTFDVYPYPQNWRSS